MDFRRMRLISWQNGYDIKDIRNREFKVIVARKIRKQEKLAMAKGLQGRGVKP